MNNTPKNKRAYLSLSLMLVFTLLTQLILVLKSSRVAAIFGTGTEMDAYNFVTSIVGFVFSFVGAGIGTVLIPSMVREQSGSRSRDGFLTILYGILLAVTAVLFVLRHPLLTMLSGNSREFVSIAASLLLVILLGQLATSLNSVATTFLQCRNCLVIPKILTLLVTFCATAVIYWVDSVTIYQYAALSFFLVLGEMVVHYWLAGYKGFRYRPCIPVHNSELKEMFRVFLPTVFGTGVYRITLMADTLISASLGAGNISILSYASIISSMVDTAISGNIMLYIYPKIAKEAYSERGKRKLLQYMLLFSTVMCGVVVLFWAAGHDAVRILFERGAFGPGATQSVFVCVLLYLLGSPINIMRDVVYRYFYSKGNTKATFYNGLCANILNVVISIILSKFMGLYGVVLGTTITAVFSFISILLRMRKQYTFGGNFPFFAGELVKILAATALSAAGCVLIKVLPLGWPSLAVSALTAVLGILIFGAVLLVTRSKVFHVDLG